MLSRARARALFAAVGMGAVCFCCTRARARARALFAAVGMGFGAVRCLLFAAGVPSPVGAGIWRSLRIRS
ncbi:hypothetical protein L3i22_064070 [Actinoplanes sp. L3-i22]|nr:hypothetical protein L3i22_064070 [Actinoplanes sp. L3-i22]